MRFPYLVSVLILAAGASQNTSCAPAPIAGRADLSALAKEPPEPALVTELGLQRLSGDDINRLVVGREISATSVPSGITTSSTEMFTRHLTYVRRGDLSSSIGQYRITENMLCIGFPAAPTECRRFYRDQAGTIYQEYVESGSTELGKLNFR